MKDVFRKFNFIASQLSIFLNIIFKISKNVR